MKSPRHDLGLGWTVVHGIAGDPTVGIRSGEVIAVSHQGVTVSNDGLIEEFSQSEAEKMLFVKMDTLGRVAGSRGLEFLDL